MPAQVYPNSGSLWLAGVVQTALANSDLKLFQVGALVLGPTTTVALLDAEECDYTGYVEQTIVSWFAPLLNPLGGASIESGLHQFAIAAPYTVPNTVQGWYLVDSTGDLVCAGDFATPRELVGEGDGIPFNIELIFGG